jgi:deoxyribose-phosphate aldolase
VGLNIGIEACGGIRSAADALAMIAARSHAGTGSGGAIVREKARIVVGAPHSQIEPIPASW